MRTTNRSTQKNCSRKPSSAVFRIQDERSSQSAESINDLLTKALDRIDARLRGVHTEGGVDTFFTDYDSMSGGLHNGELNILAARPSMGKTAFAMNVAENVALRGETPRFCLSAGNVGH